LGKCIEQLIFWEYFRDTTITYKPSTRRVEKVMPIEGFFWSENYIFDIDDDGGRTKYFMKLECTHP